MTEAGGELYFSEVWPACHLCIIIFDLVFNVGSPHHQLSQAVLKPPHVSQQEWCQSLHCAYFTYFASYND